MRLAARWAERTETEKSIFGGVELPIGDDAAREEGWQEAESH